LLIAGIQIGRSAHVTRTDSDDEQNDDVRAKPSVPLSILSGAVIGFAAGITGIGGGILLAPLMLTFGWAGVRQTAAATAAFNLLNSAAALVGIWVRHATFLLGSRGGCWPWLVVD
jgi:uncharacterized protein